MIQVIYINISITILYLLYKFCLDSKVTIRAQRFYLLLIIPIAIAISLLKIEIPRGSYNSLSMFLPLNTINISGTENASPNLFINTILNSFSNKITILIIIYLAGITSLLLLLIKKTLSTIQLYKNGRIEEINGKKIIICKTTKGAFCILGKIIINDSIYKNKNIEKVLMHEQLHCNMKHSIDIVFMFILKLFFWYNPFVWMIEKKLREIHEYEVDEKMLILGEDPKQYAQLLLNFEMGISEPYMANSFSYTSIKKRIKLIMNTKKLGNKRLILSFPTCLILVILFNLTPKETVYAQETKQTKEQTKEQSTEKVPYTVIEKKPTFQGKDASEFARWVGMNMQYPEEARKKNIQGKVIIQFIIDNNGSIIEVKAISKTPEILNDEAIRVVKSSPKWEPGEQKGKKVKVSMIMPITFSTK